MTSSCGVHTCAAAVKPSAEAGTSARGKCVRDTSMIEAAECAGVDAGRRAAGNSAAVRESAAMPEPRISVPEVPVVVESR